MDPPPTASSSAGLADVLILVTVYGFAIQQTIQLFVDPTFGGLAEWWKTRMEKGGDSVEQIDKTWAARYLKPLDPAGWKRWTLGFSALLIGMGVVQMTEFRVLERLKMHPPCDLFEVFFLGLVLSTGTQGMNSVLKLAQYAKDRINPG
jgi:hypothetical protein